MNYNIAIIGGGPAGYTAAERAAAAGLSVVLFEKEQLGGTCLNWGCIPTKSLLYSAKTYDHILTAPKYGVAANDASFDLPKIISRKNKIVRKLIAGIRARLKAHEVMMVNAKAVITGKENDLFVVQAGEEIYRFEKIILATGSDTAVPQITGLDPATMWTSKEALDAKEVPASLMIIGGGVIGMEFASFFNSMGAKVTVVEMLDEILGGMDKEIAALLRDEYRRKGVEFILGAKVLSLSSDSAVIVEKGEERTLSFERLLMAAGRRPSLGDCGAEHLGLEFEGRFLKVNAHMQTSDPAVYACGDITGRSMLAHTAEREACVAVNHIRGVADEMRYNAIPGVVYTSPEVASVGATEEELQKNGIPYQIKKLPMSYAGRFVVENEGLNGLCKLILSEDQRILGAHIIGSPCSEFIVTAGMAIQHNMTVEAWERTVFPHPTVCEIFKEVMFS